MIMIELEIGKKHFIEFFYKKIQRLKSYINIILRIYHNWGMDFIAVEKQYCFAHVGSYVRFSSKSSLLSKKSLQWLK